MGRHLVEQQERRRPVMLLTSRAWASTSRISSAFCSPVEPSAAGMSLVRARPARSVRCGPSSVRPAAGVAGAVVAQDRAVAVLDHRRRGGPSSISSIQPDSAIAADGKGRGVVPRAARIAARQAADGLGARGGDRDRELRRLALDGVEPVRVDRRISSSSRLRERSEPLERVDAAAECSASTASTRRSRKRRRSPAAPRKSAVHRRRQPDDAQMTRRRPRPRRRGRAVDAAIAAPAGPRLAGPAARRPVPSRAPAEQAPRGSAATAGAGRLR